MDEIESIERATLAAVPPEAMELLAGWLLPFDSGRVWRAHSAVPLQHVVPSPEVLNAIARRYRERGHAPVFRVPDLAAFEALQGDLARNGFGAGKPTLMQSIVLGEGKALAMNVRARQVASGAATVQIAGTPSPGWADVFLGEGLAPVDGAGRLAMLQRSADNVFAAVNVEGAVLAVGAGCFACGRCVIHGMRTLPAWRGRGFARAIVASLLAQAGSRGISSGLLQVEEGNDAARSLYGALGFATKWRYRYWK